MMGVKPEKIVELGDLGDYSKFFDNEKDYEKTR
jgi:hypothetical protein